MDDLTYEQTIELEKNVKIKNEADQLYRDFVNNFTLDVCSFKNGEFTVWSDSNNRTFITINNNVFTYHCRFLHESYDVTITPSSLFLDIKRKYRGIDHFISSVRYFDKKKGG